MDFKTLILRFRDLDIAENETIKRHQSIIDEKDHVWWAWWKKGNEKTAKRMKIICKLYYFAYFSPLNTFVYYYNTLFGKLYEDCVIFYSQ